MTFPMLGFPGEETPSGKLGDSTVYTCRPSPNTIIVVWKHVGQPYHLNLYHHPPKQGVLITHQENRFAPKQEPLAAEDPFMVQCLIFHLIQTHLPTEVTTI